MKTAQPIRTRKLDKPPANGVFTPYGGTMPRDHVSLGVIPSAPAEYRMNRELISILKNSLGL